MKNKRNAHDLKTGDLLFFPGSVIFLRLNTQEIVFYFHQQKV